VSFIFAIVFDFLFPENSQGDINKRPRRPNALSKNSKTNKQPTNKLQITTKFASCESILKLQVLLSTWRLHLPKTLTFPDERIPFQMQKKTIIKTRAEHNTMGQ